MALGPNPKRALPPARTLTSRQRRANRMCLLVGAAITVLVVLAQANGLLDWLEFKTLDLRFKHSLSNPIRARDDIAIIAIDDRSLELVGRWPWPRDVQAGILSVIHELGARSLLVDITYVEPEPRRANVPGDDFEIDVSDVRPNALAISDPDHDLAGAIARLGNTYLAYHFPPFDLERSAAFRLAVEALLRDDAPAARRALATRDRTAARLEEENRLAAGARAPLGAFQRARMVAEMQRRRLWDESRIVALFEPEDDAATGPYRDAFSRCLQTALRREVRQWLDAEPRRWELPPRELFRALFATLSDEPFENRTPFKDALKLALQETLGQRATTAQPLVPLMQVRAIARAIEGYAPVYFQHARQARRCGFVTFQPDPDAVMRRMELFCEHDRELLTQIAFSLACDELKIQRDVDARPGEIQLSTPDGPLRIQLDPQHRVIVPWTPVDGATFKILPADAFNQVRRTRHDIDQNRDLVLEVLTLAIGRDDRPDLAPARLLLSEAVRIDAERRRTPDRATHTRLTNEIDRLLDQLVGAPVSVLQVLEQRGLNLITEAGNAVVPWNELDPQSLSTLQKAETAVAANRKLLADLDLTLERLRSAIHGRICLLGYTASSLADQVATPIDARLPGVMAHANLINALLARRLVHWPPLWATLLVTAAFGFAAAALSTWRRSYQALIEIGLLALVFVAVCWMAFRLGPYWLWLTPPIIAAFLVYFAIAMYRYVFVDRERRELATALGQYTSKQIALQVAANPELCRKAEMREVTAMFTDLKGFTSISERIGAEKTQRVLNLCLGRFTDVILRQEGMINKFIGDGIFAFWNPVIYPQDDHARRACQTALDLIAGLGDLKREHAADETFAELTLRVGIATGNAIVGPCGSEQKFDYTCIGDTVNVAARLESANKFYSTEILVSGPTHAAVLDQFVCRPLGGVQVKGKRHAVQVLELLGRIGDVPGEDLSYAQVFGRAVELFQKRRFEEAAELFEFCRMLRKADPAVREYAGATQLYREHDPGPDWNGAIELIEK